MRGWLWIVAVGLVACSGKGGTLPVGDDDDDDDDDIVLTTDTVDTQVVVSEFGLDDRPANPTCVAPERPLGGGQARLVQTFGGISHSEGLVLTLAPGDPDWWYLAEQDGRIWRFEDDPAVSSKQPLLDLTARVDSAGSEKGLLGMAFHPDFQSNGHLYVYYSTSGGSGDHRSRIARFTSTDGGASFDPNSEQIVLQFEQPFSNHNGGTILFGPDGYLYLGTGDGGSAGDPGNRAQDLGELLGKMLRIDVDSGSPYGIPADNPFAQGGGRPEIFAWGLRNPFRYTFDPLTGDLWVGDVGQNDWEEVSLVELGGNYGWRIREGQACYNPSTNCTSAGLIPPYAVYANQPFGASVIAGVVYQGSAIPELQGVLLYSDFSYGDVWGLFFDPITGLPDPQIVIPNTNRNLAHYAAGPDGEVIALDYYTGRFYELEPVPGGVPDPFPQTLSETGCFDPVDPTQPVDGLIPYGVAHPFWSDGAEKGRWLALPDGETVTVGPDGDWDLPVGSVLVKEFEHGGERIETRLMVRHEDGDWAGYSYRWRSDESDADLLASGLSVDLPTQLWQIPSRGECVRCHTQAAGGSLGLETAQLNSELTYPSTGRQANQLATLEHIGMLAAPLGDPATLDVYPAVDDTTASVELRARAYLHVNCSQCHRPGGPSRTDMDLRADTAFADMGLCGDPEHGTLGVSGARVVNAGDPATSLLSLRMHRRDAYQMPPIGSTVVDEVGADLIDEWITSLTTCP